NAGEMSSLTWDLPARWQPSRSIGREKPDISNAIRHAMEIFLYLATASDTLWPIHIFVTPSGCKETAMFGIDWTNLELYHWLAIGGGGLALLAIIIYFVAPSGFKLPAGVISAVAALVAGVGVGVIGM